MRGFVQSRYSLKHLSRLIKMSFAKLMKHVFIMTDSKVKIKDMFAMMQIIIFQIKSDVLI